MIKVTLGDEKKDIKQKEYPKLMKGFDGAIVLFTSSKKGCSLNDKGYGDIGQYSDSWEMSRFTDYNLPLTLVNE